jgi:hypothetical protein
MKDGRKPSKPDKKHVADAEDEASFLMKKLLGHRMMEKNYKVLNGRHLLKIM